MFAITVAEALGQGSRCGVNEKTIFHASNIYSTRTCCFSQAIYTCSTLFLVSPEFPNKHFLLHRYRKLPIACQNKKFYIIREVNHVLEYLYMILFQTLHNCWNFHYISIVLESSQKSHWLNYSELQLIYCPWVQGHWPNKYPLVT